MRKEAKKPFSEFVDGVSCDHGKNTGRMPSLWLYCDKCGSRCARNAEGQIIEYSRGNKDVPGVRLPGME